MNNVLTTFRDYPAVAGIGLFLVISIGLTLFLGTLMQRAGMSLKPLVFFVGFLAIVGVPQAVVHLLDAWAHARLVRVTPVVAGAAASTQPELAPQPTGWEAVFGPEADPALITDAKLGLGAILGDALEAKLSFTASGESALAARFPTPGDAEAALNRYGTFFQFAQVSGSDTSGWTARRYQGQGEWNHVVTAGPELYAWTGATKESVETRRVRALGALAAAAATPAAAGAAKTQVSTRLSKNTPVMVVFLLINVSLAAGWFFKASAWAACSPAAPGVAILDTAALRDRLLAVNRADVPVSVTTRDDGRTIEVTWRYADARWFDLMRVHQMRRAHRLVLELDEAAHKVRVREYWSAFDASAGADGLRLDWHAATGMQFFQVEHRRVLGVQLDPEGRPTSELSKAYTFNLQELRGPVIEAVTTSGWAWQPVMWNAPTALRWLTE